MYGAKILSVACDVCGGTKLIYCGVDKMVEYVDCYEPDRRGEPKPSTTVKDALELLRKAKEYGETGWGGDAYEYLKKGLAVLEAVQISEAKPSALEVGACMNLASLLTTDGYWEMKLKESPHTTASEIVATMQMLLKTNEQYPEILRILDKLKGEKNGC